MCGRIDLHSSVEEIGKRFTAEYLDLEFSPRYNTPPTATIPVVLSADGVRKLALKRWGLQPFKAGLPPLFNSRADKVMQLNRFKAGVEKRRCVIPINGYYEWLKVGNERLPFYNKATDQDIIGVAGFWEGRDEEGSSCTIITTDANAILSSVHDRMPVMLTEEAEGLWLDPEVNQVDALMCCLTSFPEERTASYRVSTVVNRTSSSTPECIVPIVGI